MRARKKTGQDDLPVIPAVLVASVLLTAGPASAVVFNVTEVPWGTVTDEGTFAWAINEANTTAGADVIEVKSGLEISVD